MASTCKIYKHGLLLGTGSVAANSASVTSWSAGSNLPAILRRNVRVMISQAGTHVGRTFDARVLADNGAGTLTLSEKCPFVGA